MLTFRDGDNVRAIDITDQYLVIGTWRGTSVTTSNDGFIYLWDSYSSSFNITTSIPQGGCMALLNYKNRIMTFAGGTGQLLMNYSPFTNVQTIPNVPLTNTVEIYPGAMTNWLGLAQFGVSGYTNASNLYQGVYSYGSKTQLYPEVLNYSFSISSGVTQNTSMRIGCCYGVGNSLYVSWYDGSNYGVDCITNSNAPYSTAVFESLIFDNGELYKDKLLKALKVYHSPLVAGQSIALGYKLNRASSYTTAITNTTVGSTETKANIAGMQARFRELQFEVILGTSGSASPAVLYSGAEINDLGAERSFQWHTKDQGPIRVGDMKRGHIRNTLQWCLRKQEAMSWTGRPIQKDGIPYTQWVTIFMAKLLDPALAEDKVENESSFPVLGGQPQVEVEYDSSNQHANGKDVGQSDDQGLNNISHDQD